MALGSLFAEKIGHRLVVEEIVDVVYRFALIGSDSGWSWEKPCGFQTFRDRQMSSRRKTPAFR